MQGLRGDRPLRDPSRLTEIDAPGILKRTGAPAMQTGAPAPLNGFVRSSEYAHAAAVSRAAGLLQGR
jgi:hypothetical protein